MCRAFGYGMRSNIALVSFACICLPAAVAQAEPSAHPRSRVSGAVGLAMPEGELGVEYAFVPSPHFEIAVGAGVANLIGSGKEQSPLPQVSVMPRGRLELGRVTLAAGLGLSGGRYHQGPFRFDDDDFVTTALWANAEGGVAVAIADGWTAGVRIGVGKIVVHTAVEDLNQGRETMSCAQVTPAGGASCTPSFGALPYVGLTVGRAF